MTTVTENKGRTTGQGSKPGKQATSGKNAREVPEALIYEMDNGVPIYYRGYREVLAGKKPLDAVTGSTLVQSYIITELLKLLFRQLPHTHYEVLSGELGLQLAHDSWRVCDLAIYPSGSLDETQYNDKYAPIPPKVVIQADTKAHPEIWQRYCHRKTDQLLHFGVERVIWIFTAEPRKIMVAEPNADWRITDWTSEIELLPGVSFRLSDLMKK